MVAETVLTAVLLLGAPLWLVVEKLLHRMPARAKAVPALERPSAREAVPAARGARAV